MVERWLIDHYLSKDGDTLEAGTGGGRILYAMRDMGFTSLAGFDNVPGMVQGARSADPAGEISFDVQEATNLSYASESFDQVIYLQVILCLIESEDGRAAAIREAHRVLRSGGVALFAFLSWEVRQSQARGRAVGLWLRTLRALRRSDRSDRDWPWLHVGGRANASAFLDRGPYIHWFTSEEARALLEATGFSIVFSAGEPGDDSNAHREQDGWDTGMYFVCTKR